MDYLGLPWAIRSRLGWTPPYTMRQGLDATVAALL